MFVFRDVFACQGVRRCIRQCHLGVTCHLLLVAVGTPITRRPPRRSVQAVLPHTALTLDSGAKDTRRTSRNPWDTRTPALCRERVRSNDVSPWSTPFPPRPPWKTNPRCSAGSSVLWRSPTSPERARPPFGLSPSLPGLDLSTQT